MNQFAYAVRRGFGWPVMAGCIVAILGLAAPSRAQAQETRVTDIHEAVDNFGSGGIIEMRLDQIPFPAKVFLEHKDVLGTGPWNSELAGTIALSSSLLYAAAMDETKTQGFFRFRVQPLDIVVSEDVDGFHIDLGADTPIEDVFAVFAMQGITIPSVPPPYDPEDLQDPTPPGSVNLAAGRHVLFSWSAPPNGGAPIAWAPPPQQDDTRFLGRYKPTTVDQGEVDDPHEVPGDGGTGRIEDGWNGDGITRLPFNIGVPPEPTGRDMTFNPQVQPAPPGNQDDVGVVIPGTHVRLVVDIKDPNEDGKPDEFKITRAQSLPNSGNGLGGLPPPLVSDGYIMVLRAPNVNAPGGIYHIDTFTDPNEARAYDPPTRGSHGSMRMPLGTTYLRIPLRADDPSDALRGVVLQIYRLAVPGVLPSTALLTAEFFDRNEGAFQKFFQTTGENIIAILIGLSPPPQALPNAPVGTPTITTIHRGGSNGSKFNLAIIGDGFSSSATDQQNYQNYVNDVILDMFQNRDVAPEILNAVNIFRIDAISQDSGMTIVNGSGTVTTARNTALEYRYSGIWSRCWMEKGPNSDTIVANLLTALCPQADQTIIVLNTLGQGGCARGNSLAVTRSASWAVAAHELGHMFGEQGDEYQCNQGAMGCGPYGGSEPAKSNLTIDTNRNTVEWSQWIPPWRPVPTTSANIAVNSEDVGIFPGATIGSGQWWTGIYRPSWRGRMNDNTPPHNPVGYVAVRDRARSFQEATFRKNVVGDFNGDGRTDLVRLDDRQLALYLAEDRNLGPDDPVTGNPTRSLTGVLNPKWFRTDIVRNAAQTRSWEIRSGDILIPADFNGDGLTDLYIANLTNWSKRYLVLMRSFGDHFEPVSRYDNDLPGWQMTSGDEFYAGDVDGDGDDDLMVFNGSNWSIPYFGMMRSNGTTLSYIRRYDQYLPVWEMGRHEKFILGDYDGDGRTDVIAFNRNSWSQVHLQVQTSTGNGLTLAARYYGTIPGIWQMRRQDQLYALDFTGDGITDAAIFNGLEWGPVYLGLLRSERGTFVGVRRYDTASNPLPGWQMQRRDKHWVANFNGDNRQDLVVYNKDNWSTQYLGMLRSGTSNNLIGSWQDDWIGGWNLGPSDDFKVADFRGGAGWDDLFVFNDGWFGLLRSYQTQYALETIYRKWIHNHRYHEWGWW